MYIHIYIYIFIYTIITMRVFDFSLSAGESLKCSWSLLCWFFPGMWACVMQELLQVNLKSERWLGYRRLALPYQPQIFPIKMAISKTKLLYFPGNYATRAPISCHRCVGSALSHLPQNQFDSPHGSCNIISTGLYTCWDFSSSLSWPQHTFVWITKIQFCWSRSCMATRGEN